MKKIIRAIICLLVMIGLVYAPVKESASLVLAAEEVTIQLNKSSADMYVGTTMKLKMQGTDKKVSWSSSKKEIATVDSSGEVTAKKEGTVTIKAKVSKKTYTCKVTVKPAPTMSKTKKTVYVGNSFQLKIVGDKIGKVKWTTSDESIATVEKGKVTAKKAGTVTIKAKIGGKKLSCKVTVKPAPKLSAKKKTICVGKKSELTIKGDIIGTVKWATSDKSVATVKDGKITAKKVGTAKITATVGGKKLTCKVTVRKPMVALTFDDGPSKHTEKLLDTFEKYGGKGTFFVVGNRIDSYKSVLKRTAKEGHEIGGHSWDHSQLTKLSASAVKKQLVNTDKKILKVAGVEPTIVRVPYGATNSTVLTACKNQGLSAIQWSVDTLDWKYRNVDTVYKNVMSTVEDGDIILLHDIHGTTVDAMKKVIPALIEEGYELVTVSELLTYGGSDLKAGKVYYQK